MAGNLICTRLLYHLLVSPGVALPVQLSVRAAELTEFAMHGLDEAEVVALVLDSIQRNLSLLVSGTRAAPEQQKLFTSEHFVLVYQFINTPVSYHLAMRKPAATVSELKGNSVDSLDLSAGDQVDGSSVYRGCEYENCYSCKDTMVVRVFHHKSAAALAASS